MSQQGGAVSQRGRMNPAGVAIALPVGEHLLEELPEPLDVGRRAAGRLVGVSARIGQKGEDGAAA